MVVPFIASLFDSSNLTFTTFILVFTVCILLQRLLFSGSKSVYKLPPCPRFQLPVIGHLYLLEPNISKPFRRFRKQLGDVYRLQFGNRVCIVISGFDAIKEALVKNGDVFTYRPVLPMLEKLTRGSGIVVSTGEKWKEHRKFTLTTLRDFGMGKSRLEGTIHQQIHILFDAVDTEHGRPLDPQHLIQTNVANIICSMIFGSTFKHGDDKFKKLMGYFGENLKHGATSGIINFLPFLKYIPGDPVKAKKIMQNSAEIWNYVYAIVAEHENQFDETNISDYVSAYVHHLNNMSKAGTPTTFNNQELAGTIADLFIAGAETTTTALMWSLPLLASHPHMQTRMYEEIKNHVGVERLPAVQDKTNLVYVEAFYMEVLRYTNIAASGLPRAVSHDVEFRGYHIPSDAMVLFDMDSVLSDPNIWTDPENFRPDRFIDESGRLSKMEEFIPFSMGKRNCVGEGLARMELMLFLSAIVQRYELTCPEGTDLSMDQIDGEFVIVHKPKPYCIVFKKRA